MRRFFAGVIAGILLQLMAPFAWGQSSTIYFSYDGYWTKIRSYSLATDNNANGFQNGFQFQNLVIEKYIDGLSGELSANLGKLPLGNSSGEILVWDALRQRTALSIRFTNPRVTSVASGGTTNSAPTEQLIMEFSTISFTDYNTLAQNNQTSSWGWDVVNKTSVATLPPPSRTAADIAALQLVTAPIVGQPVRWFLRIDRINGSTTAVDFPRWFDVTSFNFVCSNFASGQTGGGGAGTATCQDFTMTKLVDQGDPTLQIALATRQRFSTIQLMGISANTGQVLQQYTFTNAAVSSFRDSGFTGQSARTTSISLAFASMVANFGTASSFDPPTTGYSADLANNIWQPASAVLGTMGHAPGTLPAETGQRYRYYLTTAANVVLEIDQYSSGASMPLQFVSGGGSGKASFFDMFVTMPSRVEDAYFWQLVASGKVLPSMKLSVFDTLIGKNVFVYDLTYCVISAVDVALGKTGISIAFGEYRVTAYSFNADGAPSAGPVTAGWSIKQNMKI